MNLLEVPGAEVTFDAITLPASRLLASQAAEKDALWNAYRRRVAQVWLAALGVPLGGAPLFPPLLLLALITAPIAAALHALAWGHTQTALSAPAMVPVEATPLRVTAQTLTSEGQTFSLDEVEEARLDGDGILVLRYTDHPVRVAMGHARETRAAMAEVITRLARRTRKQGYNTRGMLSLASLMSRASRADG